MKRTSAASQAGQALNRARNRKLTPEQRSEISRRAGLAGGRGRPKKIEPDTKVEP